MMAACDSFLTLSVCVNVNDGSDRILFSSGFMSYSALPVQFEEKSSESSAAVFEFQLFCVSKFTPMWSVILCAYKVSVV